MRRTVVTSLFLAACGHGFYACPVRGPCTFDASAKVTLNGGAASIDCDSDPLVLVKNDMGPAFDTAMDDPNRAIIIRLALAPQKGNVVVANLHIPHDLADGTYALGRGVRLELFEGRGGVGTVRFKRSRNIPAFDNDDDSERRFKTTLDIALSGLRWQQDDAFCGNGLVTVKDFTAHIEETGLVKTCDG